RQVSADKGNITKVRRLLRSLDADMGGTEIGRAIEAVIQLPGPPIPQDVLLITDGEIWDMDSTIEIAKKSGHRFFTVGVGSSVSEAFVGQLARETGGACELVAPRERMVEKIVRHFKRIYLPVVEIGEIHWPTQPQRELPGTITPLYDGDTLHVFGCFDERPTGTVSLHMTLVDGQKLSQAIVLPGLEKVTSRDDVPSPVARLAIQHIIKEWGYALDST
ncbi:MAG: VWA domain-containing protein, partial [Desulfatiglandales bacterium]